MVTDYKQPSAFFDVLNLGACELSTVKERLQQALPAGSRVEEIATEAFLEQLDLNQQTFPNLRSDLFAALPCLKIFRATDDCNIIEVFFVAKVNGNWFGIRSVATASDEIAIEDNLAASIR